MIRHICAALIGLGSGLLISGAVFAVIAAIGVITRLAQKTGTNRFIMLYEEAVIFGGVFGAAADFFDLTLKLPTAAVAAASVCLGVFHGGLAASLAEVLDMLPVLTRRVGIKKGLFWIVAALAGGKFSGALLYALVDGFGGN